MVFCELFCRCLTSHSGDQPGSESVSFDVVCSGFKRRVLRAVHSPFVASSTSEMSAVRSTLYAACRSTVRVRKFDELFDDEELSSWLSSLVELYIRVLYTALWAIRWLYKGAGIRMKPDEITSRLLVRLKS